MNVFTRPNLLKEIQRTQSWRETRQGSEKELEARKAKK